MKSSLVGEQIPLFDLDSVTSPPLPPPNFVHDSYWDEVKTSVLEDERISISALPEQRKTQWIEEYPVTRCGVKYWYFRYCFYQNRKITHIHIPGGNSESAIALERKGIVESAIALGKTPVEIKKLIKDWSHL